MNRVSLVWFLLLSRCVGNVGSFDTFREPKPPPAPASVTADTPLQVPVLKTYGQLRETYEAVTSVKVPLAAYQELSAHLPQDNHIGSLTAASQAAVVRLASAHCAEVLAKPDQAQRLFGVAPGKSDVPLQELGVLAAHGVKLWPDPAPSLSSELLAMLKDVREETSSADALLMATCTAVLASAPLTTH